MSQSVPPLGLHENAQLVREGTATVVTLEYLRLMRDADGDSGRTVDDLVDTYIEDPDQDDGDGDGDGDGDDREDGNASSYANGLRHVSAVRPRQSGRVWGMAHSFLARLKAYARPRQHNIPLRPDSFADRVLHANYTAYSDVFDCVQASLEALLRTFQVRAKISREQRGVVAALGAERVPAAWLGETRFAAPLWGQASVWLGNLLLRLEYLQEWVETRLREKDANTSNTTSTSATSSTSANWPVVLDLSKLVDAGCMLQALLCDHALSRVARL